jgi:outer membrane immunogenic protein
MNWGESQMKKLLLAGAALTALFGGIANAADMGARPAYAPPPPAYSWNGWYIGGNIGYSWGQAKNDSTASTTNLGVVVTGNALSESQNIDGVIGGVQTGYNYQSGAWVWGWETDFQGSGQKGGSTLTGTLLTGVGPVPATLTTDHKLEWFGTARSRLGFLWGPTVLVYGTAGIAYGQVKDSAALSVGAAPVTAAAIATFKDVKAGWTVGAGVEGALGGGWSAKLEYLYIDLGKTELTSTTAVNVAGAVIAANANQTFRTTDNIVRVGLNYRWGAGGPFGGGY